MNEVHIAVSLYSPLHPRMPPPFDAIIQEDEASYTVTHKADHMGILAAPVTVAKDIFATSNPDIVATWHKAHENAMQQAHQIHQNLAPYATYFLSLHLPAHLKAPDPGVACDQALLPGMKRHWGVLRQCATHSRARGAFLVCKGCRVAHHAQADGRFERGLVMARGARVFVCEGCVEKVVVGFGAGWKGCVCDAKWTCCWCREDELERLAGARERFEGQGGCEMCEEVGVRGENVEVCLLCRGVRVYADGE